MYIFKPTSASCGKGIKVIGPKTQVTRKTGYVVSQYISNPHLIDGFKYDLRIYVLVTSYRPLKVWLSSKGFARFCIEKYSNENVDIDNMMVHLTNVAISKQADDYNAEHGSKWSIDNLRFYLE